MRKTLILAVFGLAAASAPAQEAAPAGSEPISGPSAEQKALADKCSAHKFETIVKIEGRERGSRVRICGQPGQSDADFLNTLRSSITQTEANEGLSKAVKDQIVAALRTEIAARERALAAPSPSKIATIEIPRTPVSVPEAPPQYSVVPPLPAPLPRASGGSAAKLGPAVVRPRVTIRCALPHEPYAACARLQRETQLMVRADEDLAAGISVRFVRGGDNRAELDLGALRKGESMREALPGRVCAGTLRGKVQIEILTKNRVAETLGPYTLYCGS